MVGHDAPNAAAPMSTGDRHLRIVEGLLDIVLTQVPHDDDCPDCRHHRNQIRHVLEIIHLLKRDR